MKSALITGGSRGIGLGLAKRMAQLGYGLTINSRNSDALSAVADGLIVAGAQQVVTVAADLADHDAGERIVAAHAEAFPSMHALVLNAGVGTFGSIVDYPMRRLDKTLDVNFRAPFRVLQGSIPLLRKGVDEDPVSGAKVIALTSMAGVYSEPGLAVYGATKAALMSIIETLNAEESHNGISGTSIAPGYVDTDMSAWAKGEIDADAMIEVGDIVELATSVLRLSSRAVVPRLVVTRAGAGLRA